MNKPYLILINGQSATGKSEFAKFLALNLDTPIFEKDTIIELFADSLGEYSLESSNKFSLLSRMALVHITKKLMDSDISFVLEANFAEGQETSRMLEDISRRTNYFIVEVLFKARPEILYRRFKDRMTTRHAIHTEHFAGFDFNRILTQIYKPTGVAEKLIEVDTSDFSNVSYQNILNEVKNSLNLN